ncbi:hypothetical protein C8D91_1991 [Marinicella litoralis]|uniref:Uncharacterized protein n=2 Tax=Marinicella litoralis TaxID=644220 RepID=A0A4R6XIW6_9GAMM|nr:hypothetical protein C8D91_1991 [Marinicella litoralis]
MYLIGFAVLLLVFTLVINLPAFDEDLMPEVAAIKNIKATPYGANNAYPALLAINGPGTDLKISADKVRTMLNLKISQMGLDYFDQQEYDQHIRNDLDVTWQEKYPSCHSRRERACMSKVFTAVREQPIVDERLTTQLQKYHDLIALDEYSEATQLDIQAPLIAFGPVMALKRIFLANSYISDNSQDFLSDVIDDMNYWHMMLNKGHLLITKMVAVASITDGLRGLSEAIKAHHFSPVQLIELQNNINRLNLQEVAIGRVFEFEFKYGIKVFEAAESSGEMKYFGLFDFFQLNATHNMAYQLTAVPMKHLSKLDSSGFYQYLNSDEFGQEFEHPFSWSPASLYNPTGKVLMSYTVPAYTDYLARIHDLGGMIVLLKLQIELALNQEKPVKNVVLNSEFLNPYTSEPMSYNAATDSIYFTCLDKTSVCELGL